MSSAREIMVSHHVVLAYRRRMGGDNRPFLVVHDEIAECVAEGIREGRMFDHKPKGFILYGRKGTALDPRHRFVQCDESYGFIIDRNPNGNDVVVTMLSRAGVRK